MSLTSGSRPPQTAPSARLHSLATWIIAASTTGSRIQEQVDRRPRPVRLSGRAVDGPGDRKRVARAALDEHLLRAHQQGVARLDAGPSRKGDAGRRGVHARVDRLRGAFEMAPPSPLARDLHRLAPGPERSFRAGVHVHLDRRIRPGPGVAGVRGVRVGRQQHVVRLGPGRRERPVPAVVRPQPAVVDADEVRDQQADAAVAVEPPGRAQHVEVPVAVPVDHPAHALGQGAQAGVVRRTADVEDAGTLQCID